MTNAEERRSRPRTARPGLVELARVLLLAATTAAAYWVAQLLELDETQRGLVLILGVLVGYVLGGVLGRTTDAAISEVERRFARTPPAQLLAGTIGLAFGLFIAFMLTFPLFRLPPAVAYPATGFVYLVFAMVGMRVARRKAEDFFGLFGLKPRAARRTGGELNVVDTSALVDGRIVDVVRAGFLGGTALVPQAVLRELQALGDASDPSRRARGRRGLDAVQVLQRDPRLELILLDDEPGEPGDVDGLLLRVARERDAALVTNDVQLQRLAEAVGVPVRSVSRLAAAVRTPVTPGEGVEVRLTRTGRERGQGVGYLEDGTMIVVENAGDRIGTDVHVRITNVLQTPNGRMLFAELAESA